MSVKNKGQTIDPSLGKQLHPTRMSHYLDHPSEVDKYLGSL